MQDVADAAGVSKMTVSYALRHHPGISQATAERVRACASRMGYIPNPMVTALLTEVRSRKKFRVPPKIGFLNLLYSYKALRENYSVHNPQLEGAKARCEELGFDLEVFSPADEKISPQRLSQILKYRGIHGLIVVGKSNYNLDWNNFFGISLNSSRISPHYNKVIFHHYDGMLHALKKLRSMGYKRIAVTVQNQWTVTEYYHAAIFTYQQQIHARNRIPALPVSRYSTDPDYFQRWLKKHKPDILVDTAAGLFWSMLQKIGIKIPDQLAYATFSLPNQQTGLAGINPNFFQTGVTAVDLLLAQINSNRKGLPQPQHITLVSGHWVDGPTAPNLTNTPVT